MRVVGWVGMAVGSEVGRWVCGWLVGRVGG